MRKGIVQLTIHILIEPMFRQMPLTRLDDVRVIRELTEAKLRFNKF